MYNLNDWKSNHQIESQADTYIERHFEESCLFLNNGYHILNEWRHRKAQYISYTDTTIFDFQHYSKHDASHSINILESIELVLGKERIEQLSTGDLWLLLESAYYHDIGMSLSYKDLIELWEDVNFKQYIEKALSQNGTDSKEAALWYTQMDNLVKNKNKMEGIEKEDEKEFTDTWPVEMERWLLFLVADYIRKGHAHRSRKYLNRFSCKNVEVIHARLYDLVVEISIAHGKDFDYVIKNLKKEAKGFGIDKVHPRFVACLLRLGDLLDMDNNRFNIRAIEHFGPLPWSSEIHLKKHKAITHILINSHSIEAEASSKEFDVCRITNEWFHYIEEEVTNLICNWSMMAPEELRGCIMQKAQCTVYHPCLPYVFNAEHQKKFEIDKMKLMELLIGTNIYDIKMDFLREYVQNALDATKMQLWLDLLEGKYKYTVNPDVWKLEDLTPFDIQQKIYENYAIDIEINLDIQTQKVELKIIDKGIGMEEDCIHNLSKIGSGWRDRENYHEQIPKMLKWLKPTGGFGIGVQSAFMVTDHVELKTRIESESNGHTVILNSPRTTGEVSVETSDSSYPRGTTVKVVMDLSYFQLWNEEYKNQNHRNNSKNIKTRNTKNNVQEILGEFQFSNRDIFDKGASLDYVIKFLENYLRKIVINSFIPIRILNEDRQPIVIKSPFMIGEDYWLQKENYWEGNISDRDIDYKCIYDIKKDALLIWNKNDCVFTYMKSLNGTGEAAQHVPCFKNICVVHNNDFYMPDAVRFDICLDFMGYSAETALKVHRNAFNENFSLSEYVKNSITVFFKSMIVMQGSLLKKEEKENVSIKNGVWYTQIEKNLWEFPLPLIRKLYFNEISIEDNTENNKMYQMAPIMVYRCVFEMIPNDAGDEKRDLWLTEDFVSGEDMMQTIDRVLDGDKDTAIFIYTPLETVDKRVDERVDESIKKDVAFDWYIYNKCEKEDKSQELMSKENFDRQWDILDKLNEFGEYLIRDIGISNLLMESNQFEVKTVKIAKSQQEKDDICFYMLTKKDKMTYKKVEIEEFYKKVYHGESFGRYIAGMPESKLYEMLMVSKLPYNIGMTVHPPYLISPINEKIREEIALEMRSSSLYTLDSGYSLGSEVEKKYSFAKFEKLIMENENYNALIQWVYDNQVEKGKYKLQEIRAAYKRFIADIYSHTDLSGS